MSLLSEVQAACEISCDQQISKSEKNRLVRGERKGDLDVINKVSKQQFGTRNGKSQSSRYDVGVRDGKKPAVGSKGRIGKETFTALCARNQRKNWELVGHRRLLTEG